MTVNPEWLAQRAAQKRYDADLDTLMAEVIEALKAAENDPGLTDAEEHQVRADWLRRWREAVEDRPDVTAPRLLDPAPEPARFGVERVSHAVTPVGEARRRGWSTWRAS